MFNSLFFIIMKRKRSEFEKEVKNVRLMILIQFSLGCTRSSQYNTIRAISHFRKAARLLAQHPEIQWSKILFLCGESIGLLCHRRWLTSDQFMLGMPYVRRAQARGFELPPLFQALFETSDLSRKRMWFRKAMHEGNQYAFQWLIKDGTKSNNPVQQFVDAMYFATYFQHYAAYYELGRIFNASKQFQLAKYWYLKCAREGGFVCLSLIYILLDEPRSKKRDQELVELIPRAICSARLWVDFFKERNNIPMVLFWTKQMKYSTKEEIKLWEGKLERENKWMQQMKPLMKMGNQPREACMHKILGRKCCSDLQQLIWEFTLPIPSPESINSFGPPKYMPCDKCISGNLTFHKFGKAENMMLKTKNRHLLVCSTCQAFQTPIAKYFY